MKAGRVRLAFAAHFYLVELTGVLQMLLPDVDQSVTSALQHTFLMSPADEEQTHTHTHIFAMENGKSLPLCSKCVSAVMQQRCQSTVRHCVHSTLHRCAVKECFFFYMVQY